MLRVYTPDSGELLINQISRDMSWWRDKFALLGFAVAAGWTLRTVYKLVRANYQHFYGAIALKSRLNSFGKWAVITGCTRGLGREFAIQLAELGLNIILIGRNHTELNKLAKEIESKYNIATVRIFVDFSYGRPVYPEIELALESKDVGILVNNVGVMYPYPENFHLVDEQMLWDIVNVNIGTMMTLTHIVLNKCMIPKKKGLIVNLASSAAYNPTPLMSAYSASKKFVDYLSVSLNYEMKYLGFNEIHVQSLVPLYLATDMTSFSSILRNPLYLLNPSANTYVRNALWTFGITKRTTGFWSHSVQLWFASLLPESVWCWIGHTFLSYARKQYLNRRNI